MRVRQVLLIGLGVAAVLTTVLASSAPAGLYYAFKGPAPGSAFVLAPGATMVLDVYLVEDTTTDTSVLIPHNGLLSAEALLEQTTDTTPSHPAQVLLKADISPEVNGVDLFDGLLTLGDGEADPAAGIPGIVQDHILRVGIDAVGVLGTVDGPIRTIPVGAFTITAGATPGDVTTLRVIQDPGFDNIVLWDSGPIDHLVSPSAPFTITVIPEPTALALFVAAGAVATSRRTCRGTTR